MLVDLGSLTSVVAIAPPSSGVGPSSSGGGTVIRKTMTPAGIIRQPTNTTVRLAKTITSQPSSLIQNNHVSKVNHGGVVTSVVQVSAPSTTPSTSGTTASGGNVEMPGDTLQLMGMASSLPTSNLFVNYPHTMWGKDDEGNRVPMQVIKQEGTGATGDVGIVTNNANQISNSTINTGSVQAIKQVSFSTYKSYL